MKESKNVKKHIFLEVWYIAVQSAKSKVHVALIVFIMENMFFASVQTKLYVERLSKLVKLMSFEVINVLKNVNGFVKRNAFLKDFLEDGLKSVNSLHDKNHSNLVSLHVQNMFVFILVLIIVHIFVFLINYANVFEF